MNTDFVIWALENAVKYKGQAVPNAIIGKLLHQDPENRSKMKEFMPQIKEAVDYVNSLSYDDQVTKLKELHPDFFGPKEERNIFAFLHINDGDTVVTAFPPGPEKYPHIGHAKALYLNYELAKKYKGAFLLRFEDTNPKLVKKEFYDIMLDNFAWLGVTWDDVLYASDFMELYYRYAEQLIQKGLAYVDKSSQEDIQNSRATGKASKYRDLPVDEQMSLWKEFLLSEPGQMVVLLKIDLQHKNSTMRDPAIMRIITEPHARHGTRYRAWPGYDFQNAIMDGHTGVSHRLRSIEFEMRAELHRYIRSILDLPQTVTYEFGRFNMDGVESSGRIIREKITQGELTGWDDPSLTTLVALRKRGFQPEAIKAFVLSTGITKNTATLTWDDLYRQNTKVMDAQAKRLFFVENPVHISVAKQPRTLKLHMHPQQELGYRQLADNGQYFIAQKDFSDLPFNQPIRMMENCTVMRTAEHTFSFVGDDVSTFKGKGKSIIHYVPEQGCVDVIVITPEKEQLSGKGEATISSLREGECVQFERFGNVRFDHISDGVYYFYLTHRI